MARLQEFYREKVVPDLVKKFGYTSAMTFALVANQDVWSKTGNLRPVVARGLTRAEMKTVESLVNDPSIEAAIVQDMQLGVSSGVNSTPTMIVTHKLQTYSFGGISYPILSQVLDGLARK